MAKSSSKPPPSTTKRPMRTSAPVSFTNERSSEEPQHIAASDDDDDAENGKDDDLDLDEFMEKFQKRQAKKTTILSSAFDNQKKGLYGSARKQAKDMSQEGLVYLENLKATLIELKKDEIPFMKYLNEVEPLWKNREPSLTSLYELYPSAIDDLFVRRAQTIDDASGMLRTNPSKRERALRSFLENARSELDRSRQNEMDATDASKLIKHYKALLLA
ncbi:hypothetical protein DFJ43DRAFT_1065831 [Lentinula guzmanii]|uniref:Uncharacterized protein n=1 Tax=Lentinula guzmanii TaxID=2804957 RepID=A0AA38N1L5_9AGAR|nr:hypothetical protein DFJ43DRAFT_1065831 [Lentinula guzmanii]